MEEEIDLRPYFYALLRRWRLIALIVFVAVTLAVILALLTPPAYTARADVLILSARSELMFDERFVTSDVAQDLNAPSRHQALVTLASSSTLEEQARAQLPAEIAPPDAPVGALAGRVEVSREGDLLQITAGADDPQAAYTLANTWGQVYVQTVNELYSDNQSLLQELEQQQREAQQRYDSAQQELETFIGTGELVQIEQQMNVMQDLIDGSRSSNQSLYTQYLSRTQELELILNDAQTLREQVAAGQTDEFSRSLATLALRSRTAGDVQLPIDLRFDTTEGIFQSDDASLSDLDSLITILRDRRGELFEQSQQLAQAIATGSENVAGLPTALRTKYEQELAQLQQKFEQQTARKLALEQQRNVALESLTILQRKLDEQRIAQGTSASQVRLVGVVNNPQQSKLFNIITNSFIALIVSSFVSVLLVIGLEIIGPRIARQSSPAAQGDRPVDRPMTS